MCAFAPSYRLRRGGSAAAVLAPMLLAGCVVVPNQASPTPAVTASSSEHSAPTTPRIATLPPKPPPAVHKPQAQPPATVAEEGGDDSDAPGAPAVLEPERLVGLGVTGLHDALGPPLNIDDAGPAEIWEYAVGDCRVRFFLYPEIGSGNRRTLRYETAPAPGAVTDCKPPLNWLAANSRE